VKECKELSKFGFAFFIKRLCSLSAVFVKPEFFEIVLVSGNDIRVIDDHQIFIISVVGGKGPVVRTGEQYAVIDNGKFVMHNIIVGADSDVNSLLCQETGLAVKIDRLFLIQIEPDFLLLVLGLLQEVKQFLCR